jgi:succinate dehydrogenase (ubiquinone) cytochrome b560 subunit
MLILPGSFPHYLALVNSMHFGGALIFATKFALAWPFMFHFANGLRHLAWDLGKGFENKEVTATGWTVVGLSTLFAAVVAAM